MRTITLVICAFFLTSVYADQMHFQFGNPSFSGSGYSSHVLSIEQLQYSREQDAKDARRSATAAAEREEKNKTINKFIANVESRIYANLSKQLVDNMFGEGCSTNCATSGTADVEGSVLYWIKDETTGDISLTITATDGTVTQLTVPVGDFSF